MKIAIVNDLSIAIEAIRRVLVAAGHQVAWVARTGVEAVEKCAQSPPDLILMDLIMPVLDGVGATRRIMAATPCPILLVTATVDSHTDRIFEALGAGALDVVRTPVLGATDANGPALLLEKIDNLGKRLNVLNFSQKLPTLAGSPGAPSAVRKRLVAIGASAGGPMALMEIMCALPKDFPAAIVIIQHLDAHFIPGMAEWIGGQSQIPVRLANEGDRPEPGVALIAGRADHLIFADAYRLGYTPYPIENVYRPSVDVFFESLAKQWRGEAVGVLLTGMGRDGAKGLKAMREAGYHTIAQDKSSSAVYGMPKAAVAMNAAVDVLSLNQIAPALEKIFASPSTGTTSETL